MPDLSRTLQLSLAAVLVVLGVLSLQLTTLAALRITQPPRRLRVPLLPDEVLPEVLVQLPVCDEGDLALRVASAAARLDWPKDKLHIQLLDDGPAHKHEALKAAVLAIIPSDINFPILRRGDRSGFK